MKTLLVILSIFVFSFNASAQLLSGYGIKLGVGFSNQSWDYDHPNIYWDFEHKTGITPRLFADFLDLSILNIEAELGYLRKGVTDKAPITTAEHPEGTGEYIISNNSLDYISVSILLKPKYKSLVISPYLIIGPQLNILLNKDIDKYYDVVYKDFRESNYGFSVGAGAEIKNIFPITSVRL